MVSLYKGCPKQAPYWFLSLPIVSGEIAVKMILQPKHGPENREREIEVRVISAQDLKNVKHITKMRTYAVVYVEHGQTAQTHVDETHDVNPVWNETLTVKFRESLLESDIMAALNVDIYAHGHVREKPVGSARVLLSDVLKDGNAAEPVDNPIQCVTLQVRRPSGRPQGLVNLLVPPTGKFLIQRESLSVSVVENEEEAKEVAGGGGAAAE